MSEDPMNQTKKRFKLSPEQKAMIKAAFDGGLTGIGAEHTKGLEELEKKTKIPMKTLKKSILNRRRGKQKKKPRVIPSASINKGKSHFTGYNLFCQETGSLSSDEAERHAKWSALWHSLTEDQRQDYNSRARALNRRPLSDLTEAEKELKAKAIVMNIGKEVAELQHLGGHAFFAVHSIENFVCHGTNVGLQVWSEVKENVILSFHKRTTGPAKLPPPKKEKNDMRMKVQNKLAKLYGTFLNGPPKLFPYKLYHEGKLHIKIHGLPSGTKSLREPGRMGTNQMEDLLTADISFEAMTEAEISASNTSVCDDEQPPQILEQSTLMPGPVIAPQAVTADTMPSCGNSLQASQLLQQLSSSMPSQIIASQENDSRDIPNEEEAAFIVVENAFLKDSSIIGPYPSDNEVEVESCSPSEALQKAVQFAKKVEEKMLPKAKRKCKGKKSYMKGLVGRRVSQLWTLSNGKKDWFDGTIIEKSEDQFAMIFDGETETYPLSAANAKLLLKKKSLRFLDV